MERDIPFEVADLFDDDGRREWGTGGGRERAIAQAKAQRTRDSMEGASGPPRE